MHSKEHEKSSSSAEVHHAAADGWQVLGCFWRADAADAKSHRVKKGGRGKFATRKEEGLEKKKKPAKVSRNVLFSLNNS